MLARLSQRVEKLWLLTDSISDTLSDELAQYPRLELVVFDWARFAQDSFTWLTEREGEVDIVHDTMGCFASYFQSHGPSRHRSARLVSTLYTNNWGWFHRVRRRRMDFGISYVGQRVLTLWKDRRVCRNADRVFVLGPGHEHDIIAAHGVPVSRVTWIPSEVNTERFYPPETPAVTRPTILFTGAICRNKGIDTLLDACSLLAERGEEFSLRLVGRVLYWEEQWLADACKSAGLGERLTLTGAILYESLLWEYQDAGVFAFPSRFEGSPRSLREAVACGTSAVVTDIPGHRGIDPHGEFMRFVQGNDPELWADALSSALRESSDRYQRRAEDGAAHMRSVHSLESVAGRLAELYTEVLAEPAWSVAE